jgi:hypothetical protein
MARPWGKGLPSGLQFRVRPETKAYQQRRVGGLPLVAHDRERERLSDGRDLLDRDPLREQVGEPVQALFGDDLDCGAPNPPARVPRGAA